MPKAAAGTTREAQRLATHERLFTAAITEFKRTGVANADVGAIVREAGVAHGTFFFHFPTKEHVLAELGQREEERMARELKRFLATPRDLRTTLLEVVHKASALERRLGTVLFKDMLALYFSPERPELETWSAHPVIVQVIEEFRRHHDEHGGNGDVDPANSAKFFLLGHYALMITHDRSKGRADVLDQFVISALRGMGID